MTRATTPTHEKPDFSGNHLACELYDLAAIVGAQIHMLDAIEDDASPGGGGRVSVDDAHHAQRISRQVLRRLRELANVVADCTIEPGHAHARAGLRRLVGLADVPPVEAPGVEGVRVAPGRRVTGGQG